MGGRHVGSPAPIVTSNAAIAKELFVTEAAVGKHVRAIFTKLELPVGRSQEGAGSAGLFAGEVAPNGGGTTAGP